MKAEIAIGLHGLAPRDYAKHVAFAKRLLKKAPLAHWLKVAEALRGFVYPFTEGEPFDLWDLERKETIALAHVKKLEDERNKTPTWLSRGFANEQPGEAPELGEEWKTGGG